MLQIKTDLYRYVHYTSNVAVCNYQEIIGCDVSFMVVLISERHGGLFKKNPAPKDSWPAACCISNFSHPTQRDPKRSILYHRKAASYDIKKAFIPRKGRKPAVSQPPYSSIHLICVSFNGEKPAGPTSTFSLQLRSDLHQTLLIPAFHHRRLAETFTA